MPIRIIPSALALCAALFGATLGSTLPARTQEAGAISGGFDVGPGGFQGNFNPLAATGGFTWLSLYFEPLVTYDDKLEKILNEKGYNIARRTVAKYREQLNIPVARLRKEM